MSDPAQAWAALNLRCTAQTGLRRRIIARAAPDSDPSAILRAGAGPADDRRDEARFETEARAEIETARRAGIELITLADRRYPALLRGTTDRPLLLYVRGALQPEDVLAIAVVGSRRATPQGIELAERIAADLAAEGFVVVSGLARGIDAAAHRGALQAGGRTLAVLGSGLQNIYPVEHTRLAGKIAAQGAVISELPLAAAPLKRHFPERNRLIAWLTWATVVVEGTSDSGSLITADLAAAEGRTVFAVPGPVGEPQSEGTNALLRQGALVCRSAGDIIEDLAPQLVEASRGLRAGADGGDGGYEKVSGAARRRTPGGGSTPDQRLVLQAMPARRGIGIEELGRASGLDPGKLLATLLELEIAGRIRQLPGRRFVAVGDPI
jgi:DNA processing protein